MSQSISVAMAYNLARGLSAIGGRAPLGWPDFVMASYSLHRYVSPLPIAECNNAMHFAGNYQAAECNGARMEMCANSRQQQQGRKCFAEKCRLKA
eukprot:1141698-Pelagomonas_calceolata.AAC.1